MASSCAGKNIRSNERDLKRYVLKGAICEQSCSHDSITYNKRHALQDNYPPYQSIKAKVAQGEKKKQQKRHNKTIRWGLAVQKTWWCQKLQVQCRRLSIITSIKLIVAKNNDFLKKSNK